MALTVNTNVTSLNVQKNLNRASDALSTSMTRLSSGLKINSAKDDAAGLQIATRMTSQIRGQTMAIKNANDGISIAQTAEGAMQESTNILQRMRELAVQSRNDSNGTQDRVALNKEFAQMSDELTRIAKSTNLNGKNLIDGPSRLVPTPVPPTRSPSPWTAASTLPPWALTPAPSTSPVTTAPLPRPTPRPRWTLSTRLWLPSTPAVRTSVLPRTV
jgi:flagellin-like hook-associated protein FlgL